MSFEYFYFIAALIETPVLFRNMTSELQNKNRTCLAIERKFHATSQLIDLDCSLQRPFICEQGKYCTNAILSSTDTMSF